MVQAHSGLTRSSCYGVVVQGLPEFVKDEFDAFLECGILAYGFSLHVAVRCGAGQRKALERLCRYITRPAISKRFCDKSS
jgi:hypothetical protein